MVAIFWQFWEGTLGPFRLGKLVWQTPKLGKDLGQFPIQSAQILTACG